VKVSFQLRPLAEFALFHGRIESFRIPAIHQTIFMVFLQEFKRCRALAGQAAIVHDAENEF